MLTFALDRPLPYRLKVIAYNGKLTFWELAFDEMAYQKFQACALAIITIMIWLGGILLAAKEVPPAIQFVYNVIIIIMISLLYGFLDVNIKRR